MQIFEKVECLVETFKKLKMRLIKRQKQSWSCCMFWKNTSNIRETQVSILTNF